MKLYCSCEQIGPQGCNKTYSGTRNPLSAKMRAKPFGFVFSQVCHEISCYTVRLLLTFHKQRHAGRER